MAVLKLEVIVPDNDYMVYPESEPKNTETFWKRKQLESFRTKKPPFQIPRVRSGRIHDHQEKIFERRRKVSQIATNDYD